MTAPTNSIYSVTRKLDLASLLVFTAAYGFLFAFMNLLHFGPLAFSLFAGFFTCVGLSQALLFGGKTPRLASSLTGAIYLILIALDPFELGASPYGPRRYMHLLIPCTIFGLIAGYFSGTCIGGILLVIDYLRKRIHSHGLTENGLRREKGEEEGH